MALDEPTKRADMDSATQKNAPSGYALGDAPEELDRLVNQARHLKEHTALVLRMARLMPGQQVLDLGCGLGDVTLTAAEIVGPKGFVVGVDHSAAAIRGARERALSAGVNNVEFVMGDITDLKGHRQYDAIVGRLIAMHLTDAVGTLARLKAHLRPGGLLVLQEIDVEVTTTEPRCATIERARDWVATAFRAANCNPNSGTSLYRILRQAGYLPHGAFASQPTFVPATADGLGWFAQTVRTLMPWIEASGTTRAEVEIESLAARMIAEVSANDALVLGPRLVGAWARAPRD
jgi:ubiquinone/menaquinone biosynthesis C-methylase UbiE